MGEPVITVGHRRLRAQLGNIVQARTEAIVNAANADLAGGGGVDGAIHDAAGPELYELTRPFGGCPTGSAVITAAGRIPLPTKRIIHAVGPVYSRDRDDRCAVELCSAYNKSLELAAAEGLRSVAFPAISTGVYGYPPERAAVIAVDTVRAFLDRAGSLPRETLELVVFVLFSESALQIYERLFAERSAT
jgi:serine/threonine-protein kinase